MASENNPTIQNDTLSNQLPNSYLLPVPPNGRAASDPFANYNSAAPVSTAPKTMHKKRKVESSSKGTKRTHARNGSTLNRCHGSSNQGKQGENTGRWSTNEHTLFLSGIQNYGKDWKRIADLIPSRTVVQTRTHAQKYVRKVAKQQQAQKYVYYSIITKTPEDHGTAANENCSCDLCLICDGYNIPNTCTGRLSSRRCDI